jgi:hypothetical protein
MGQVCIKEIRCNARMPLHGKTMREILFGQAAMPVNASQDLNILH